MTDDGEMPFVGLEQSLLIDDKEDDREMARAHAEQGPYSESSSSTPLPRIRDHRKRIRHPRVMMWPDSNRGRRKWLPMKGKEEMGLQQLLREAYDDIDVWMRAEEGFYGLNYNKSLLLKIKRRPVLLYQPLMRLSCFHGDKSKEILYSMLTEATDKPIEDAYAEAVRRLPVDDMPDLVECILLGGHCIGLLDPVSNIILNALNLMCRRRAGEYLPSEDCLPSATLNPNHRNNWTVMAFRSYCGLLTFMRIYFRYLSEEQARFYLHLSGGDLLVAIFIAELELGQSAIIVEEDIIIETDKIIRCHPDLFRDRAKFALRIAAIKVEHPMPEDVLLLCQPALQEPSESMKALLVTLEEGRCLSVEGVNAILKVLRLQHLKVSPALQLTLPHAPSSEGCSDSCLSYYFDAGGGGSMAATLTFQRQAAFNINNIRRPKGILKKIMSCVNLIPGFTPPTPMEIAGVSPTCQHIESLKMCLLDTIHAFFIEAIAKVPRAALQDLLHGILMAGHCYGPLNPVANIIIHAVWYNTIAPPRHCSPDREPDPDILGATALRRLELSSLDGLIAAVRAATDFSFSEHKAVQYLCLVQCNLSLLSDIWMSQNTLTRVFFHASKAANFLSKDNHMSCFGSSVFEPRTLPMLAKILRDGGIPLSDACITKLHQVCRDTLSSNPVYEIAQDNIVIPDIAASKKLQQKQVFLRSELRELLRHYAIQHPWEPMYDLEMICGVEEHTSLSYLYYYHVNFLAVPESSAPRVLFFAQLQKLRSQSEQSGGGNHEKKSFCCPLHYYGAKNPFLGRCSMCESRMSKIVHPSSGAHIDSVHTEPKCTVDALYVDAPKSMNWYHTNPGDLNGSGLAAPPLDKEAEENNSAGL